MSTDEDYRATVPIFTLPGVGTWGMAQEDFDALPKEGTSRTAMVVRIGGGSATHVASVLPGGSRPFVDCGAQRVRGRAQPVTVMPEGTPVTCRKCVPASGSVAR